MADFKKPDDPNWVCTFSLKRNLNKKLLLNKSNFLAISGYVWNNKKYKPTEAISKLK